MSVHVGKPRLALLALLAAMLLSIAACGKEAPPVATEFKPEMDRISAEHKALDELIKEEKKKFDSLNKDPVFDFADAYTPADTHAELFDAAKAKLKESKTFFEKTVTPLAKTWSEANETNFALNVEQQNKLLAETRRLATDPAAWLALLGRAHSEPDALKAEAASAAKTAEDTVAGVEPLIAKAKTDFTKQTAEIDRRFNELVTLRDTTISSANAIKSAQAAGNEVKFATLSKSATDNSAQAVTDGGTLKTDLEDLGSRITQTLIDIQVTTFITVVRTSWDESSDDGDKNYLYQPVQVSQPTAEALAGLPADFKLASDVKDDGGETSIKIDKAIWAELGFTSTDKEREKAPGSHNHFEWYLEDLEDVYCHKLQEYRDGETSTSMRSDPADNDCAQYDTEADLAKGQYWEEGDDLGVAYIGMDVYAKGYGDFSDQATEEASPPGMVYVGDPETGEWKEDSNGNSYWAFYGRYRFFSDLIGGSNPYYYRNEYDTWNRDYRYAGKPYYAPDSSGTNRFGGTSPLTSNGARFPGSTYVSSGLQDATVRNAGAVARSGGPGGGGK